ncbi:MAG: 50S ribosomal protein L11 methyltransferase [Pseudomonadota bacterium]
MSSLQIEFPVTPERLEQAEEILFGLGCSAVSLISDTDEPVLEPAPGETPLWDQITLRAWFPLSANFEVLRQQLAINFPDLRVDIAFVGEAQWQNVLGNDAIERLFADRLKLLPKSKRGEPIADLVPLYLEPGLAFGSGTHPTTAMCLEWIASQVACDDDPPILLDFGCGSGILAVAAALLGAQVVAVDYDAQAVMATTENAEYNGVADRCRVLSLEEWQQENKNLDNHFDIVVANILAQPLINLADDFQRSCKAGGSIVLSGILSDQADKVISAYTQTRLVVLAQDEEWVLLHGNKPG